jgi:hypothetical protein
MLKDSEKSFSWFYKALRNIIVSKIVWYVDINVENDTFFAIKSYKRIICSE